MKEPFMNHMFPDCYSQPWEDRYQARTESATVYSYYEKFRNDDDRQYCEYCDEELGYEDGEYLDCDCPDAKDEQSYRGKFPKLSKITLQTIIDMLPPGVKPSDVTISMSIDVGSMSINGQELTFSYQKTFEADPEGFKAAKAQYEKNYQAYLVERKKYDDWVKQQEIQALEAKLAKLKK
jgi:hypothetical protein